MLTFSSVNVQFEPISAAEPNLKNPASFSSFENSSFFSESKKMASTPTFTSEHPPDVDWDIGVGYVFLVAASFQILHQILMLIPVPGRISQGEGHQADFRRFRWYNLVVSFCHAAITGLWSVTSVLANWNTGDDFMGFVSWSVYGVCCFTTGYFLYDTLDNILAGKWRERWEILAHHLAILTPALYVVYSFQAVGYYALSMTIEVNTFFLHFRKLMQLAGNQNGPLARCVQFVNLLTFVIFRFGPLLIVTLAIPKHYQRVPRWFFVHFTTCMIVLNCINVVLFYRLLRVDYFPSESKRRRLIGAIPQEDKLCDGELPDPVDS